MKFEFMKIGIKETLSTSLEDLPGEIWKEITGYEDRYLVSNYARVKSIIKRRCIILNKSISSGRFKVTLVTSKGHIANEGCGRLVAKAFIREPKENEVIRYKDKNVLFDIATNVEWATKKESAKESFKKHMMTQHGERNGMAVLTKDQVLAIRKKRTEGKTYDQIKSEFNVCKSTIHNIITFKKWKTI